MTIPAPTIHRVAALVFLIGSLVLLADRTARAELELAIGAYLSDAVHIVASTEYAVD